MFEDFWYDLKDGDGMTILLAVLMIAMLLVFGFLTLFVLDYIIVDEPTYYPAVIVDGIYQPDTRETNAVPVTGINSSGGVTTGMAVVSSGSSEDFILMIKDSRDGEIYSISVSPTIYYNVVVGDKVRVEEKLGKIFGQAHRTVLP